MICIQSQTISNINLLVSFNNNLMNMIDTYQNVKKIITKEIFILLFEKIFHKFIKVKNQIVLLLQSSKNTKNTYKHSQFF